MNLPELGLSRSSRNVRQFNKKLNKISKDIQNNDGCSKVGRNWNSVSKLSKWTCSSIYRVAKPVLFFTMCVYFWLAVIKLSNETLNHSYRDLSKNTDSDDIQHVTTNYRKGGMSHPGLSVTLSDQHQHDQHAAEVIKNSSYYHDYVAPVNKHNYKYIHNPESLCKVEPKNVFLLIMITSFPMDAARRDMIRLTYGNPNEWLRLLNHNSVVKVAFLLGKSTNATLQTDIDKESNLHGDIIQEDFVDFPTLPTSQKMKTMMGLQWVTTHCANALHVMKCDDTTVIIQAKFFASVATAPTSGWAGGSVHPGFPVIRDSNHECYVSKKVFSTEDYPPYLSGQGYILTTDLVEDIYKLALTKPSYHSCPWEDVFIGICMKQLNVTPNNIKDFVKDFSEEWFTDFADNQQKRQMVKRFSLMTNLDPKHISLIWQLTKITI